MKSNDHPHVNRRSRFELFQRNLVENTEADHDTVGAISSTSKSSERNIELPCANYQGGIIALEFFVGI